MLKIDLMLKGGGCENVGAQYRLPDSKLGAGRDLAGFAKSFWTPSTKPRGRVAHLVSWE
jgi:fumarate hydratase, class I